MSDDWTYWRNALAGKFLPVHEGDPQSGFYRKKERDGVFVPVAIFEHQGGKVAKVGERAGDATAIWTWVCDKPISHETYLAVIGGAKWPDDPPTRQLSNLPDDPFEALRIEFEAESEAAAELLKSPVTSEQHANQIAVLSKRLTAIKTKAEKHHKDEKQPHLDAGRTVDGKWRDLKEEPDTLAKKLKRHLDAYLHELERKELERQRIAREDAARKQAEAEAAARAVSAGDDAAAKDAERKAEEAQAAFRETEARNASAGRTGARVSLRTYAVPRITDFDTLLMALKDRTEVVEVVNTLANRAAKAGAVLPGMEIIEEKRAA